MNGLLVASGSVALFTTIGQFLIGSRQFLRPMLATSFDPVARKVMHCVFHYVSVFLLLSTAALFAVGFELEIGQGTTLLIRFIAINYIAFAVWQLALASISGIPNGICKLFQWVFFVLIAVLAWMGA